MNWLNDPFEEPSDKTESFHQSPGTVLLDASTVEHLASYLIFSGLTENYFADSRIGHLLEGMLRQHAASGYVHADCNSDLYSLTQVLTFLEQWLLADRVVVDESAVESICQHHNSQEETSIRRVVELLFEPVRIHSSRCYEAAQNVISFQQIAKEQRFDFFLPSSSHPIFNHDLCLKDDYLGRLGGLLGKSNNTPGRAMFYLELSRLLEVPMLLHPRKVEHLAQLGQALEATWRSTYNQITEAVRTGLKYEETELPIPPLADEIIRLAKIERCSLVEAAKQLRRTRELIALRKKIQEIGSLATGNRNVEARRMLSQEAGAIVAAITSRQSPEGIISRKTVNIAELPAIGWVLKVFGKSEITVPDVVLREQPYVTLFSRWANSVQKHIESK
jgi:hypothetical protein